MTQSAPPNPSAAKTTIDRSNPTTTEAAAPATNARASAREEGEEDGEMREIQHKKI